MRRDELCGNNIQDRDTHNSYTASKVVWATLVSNVDVYDNVKHSTPSWKFMWPRPDKGLSAVVCLCRETEGRSLTKSCMNEYFVPGIITKSSQCTVLSTLIPVYADAS